jgi:hypothetical protein
MVKRQGKRTLDRLRRRWEDKDKMFIKTDWEILDSIHLA